ncbi:unnamed protein product [Mytilus coruscus]|uniref:Uncharacterized protein n=1 Tax=Mytilus coruscus TaxID=42192 RepID=A0A6J8ACB2_MYTCO|nr:unnamed protein product [Mytilus coruscus]
MTTDDDGGVCALLLSSICKIHDNRRHNFNAYNFEGSSLLFWIKRIKADGNLIRNNQSNIEEIVGGVNNLIELDIKLIYANNNLINIYKRKLDIELLQPNIMASRLSQEEENYVRMGLLLTGISPRAARALFDREFAPACLDNSLKKEYNKLRDLQKKRVINQAQWKLLTPRSPGKYREKCYVLVIVEPPVLEIS